MLSANTPYSTTPTLRQDGTPCLALARVPAAVDDAVGQLVAFTRISSTFAADWQRSAASALTLDAGALVQPEELLDASRLRHAEAPPRLDVMAHGRVRMPSLSRSRTETRCRRGR